MIKPGLKDHQIAALVNAVAEELRPLVPHECLRQVISQAATAHLEQNGLRLDGPVKESR